MPNMESSLLKLKTISAFLCSLKGNSQAARPFAIRLRSKSLLPFKFYGHIGLWRFFDFTAIHKCWKKVVRNSARQYGKQAVISTLQTKRLLAILIKTAPAFKLHQKIEMLAHQKDQQSKITTQASGIWVI